MSLRRLAALTFAALLAALAFTVSPAGAVENPSYTAPPPSQPVGTPPEGQSYNVVNRPSAPGKTSVAESRQRLPITGSDVFGLVVVGVLFVGGGAAILAYRKRSEGLTA